MIVIGQGLFELVGLGSFLSGYFLQIYWLMLVGGLMVVLDDVIEIGMEILNPLFPLILATGLALVFTPWYVGVFWASAGFKVLGIPTALMKVFQPRGFMAVATRQGNDL